MNLKANLCILLLVSTFLIPATTEACAWSEEWESDFYRFYEPEFEKLEAYKPFHFTFDRLYDYELLDDRISQSANLEGWQQHLGPNFKQADIQQAVYKMSVDELESIKNHPNGSVAMGFSANSLVNEWKAKRKLDVLDYLILAHRAEPFCMYEDPWGEEPRLTEGIEEVIEAAKSGAKAASDPFLKLRYSYQAVRLQQYGGMNEQAIETYRLMALPHLAADPLIGQWTMCHYAGCLRALELEAEAAYTFSRVFDLCPSRRIQAWYGWRILNDDIWESVQAKCKNNHEMAIVYFLRGYAADSDPLDDMRQIHELDPSSQLLEVLLIREINKLENTHLGFPFSEEKPFHERLIKGNANDLQAFVAEVMASGKMHDRSVWQLAHIYLHFLNGNMAAASTELKEKQDQLSAEGQLKAKMMDLVFRIAATKAVDRSVENTILKDYTNLSAKLPQEEAEQLRHFRDDAFAWLYEAQGEKAKALLARDRAWKITDAPIDIELVNDMLAFEEKADKTVYEKELLTRLGEGSKKNWLLEVKGTGLLAKNLIPEAIRVFQQIPESYRTASESFSLKADPFRAVTTDVVNCEDCGGGKYTKLSYAEAMVDLQKKAVAEPSKAVEYNLLIGNGYYNTTYFGAAWNAKDFYRSGGSWGYLGERSEWFTFNPDSFDEIVDMSLAKDHYMKALTASKDKELGALAAFMVAKCELNQTYMGETEAPDGYFTGFTRLRDDYRKTDVFKDLVKECWYLRAYAADR